MEPDRGEAKRLSDEGAHCAMRGDMQRAREKWNAATQADPTWSVPFFNLAKSYIDERQFERAEQCLNEAERLASAGTSSEDTQVVQQVGMIRTQISLQSELRRRGRI